MKENEDLDELIEAINDLNSHKPNFKHISAAILVSLIITITVSFLALKLI